MPENKSFNTLISEHEQATMDEYVAFVKDRFFAEAQTLLRYCTVEDVMSLLAESMRFGWEGTMTGERLREAADQVECCGAIITNLVGV